MSRFLAGGVAILVGCGALREEHALGIWETRMSRLDERGQVSAAYLANVVSGDVPGNQAVALAALELTLRACDTYATLEQAEPAVTADADIYAAVWPQATALRQAGGFEAALSQVRCPVLAIHGDYDPHPIDGIRIPLADTCPTARIITLARCGHTPWDERHARDAFFEVLERETRSTRQ